MDDPDSTALETPAQDIFIAPSVQEEHIVAGHSYTYHSPIPKCISNDLATECVLGIDEAGRGPVLGPMVYGLLYLPLALHTSLLADQYHFDDSKVLTPDTRSSLLRTMCESGTDLHKGCGWATRVMSARDISAGMLKPAATNNLNTQAMDATIELIKEVFAKGLNVKEVYIDTIGSPAVYQRKLERIFPTTTITVAKKADSLYPCVSAASVCAKVTRDAALEVSYRSYAERQHARTMEGWGSGYPSDPRTSNWLKASMDPFFGWGAECRFGWSTAKDLLDTGSSKVGVAWPTVEDDSASRLTDFFTTCSGEENEGSTELTAWYGGGIQDKVI